MSERMPQQHIIDLVAGYWRAKVVQVFAALGIADHFARQARSVAELALACDASSDGLGRLLRAAEHCGLVSSNSDGHYVLSVVGATLRSGIAGSMRQYATAMMDTAHWQSWQALDQAVMRGQTVTDTQLGTDFWRYQATHADEAARFSGAMGELSTLVALDVATPDELAGVMRIADIGGSHGVLLGAMLRKARHASGVVIDRPEVTKNARAEAGLEGRMQFMAGDFFAEIPVPADLYLLKQILHDYDDAHCQQLLRNLAETAPRAAQLWIIEMVLPEHGDAGLASLVDLNMLVLFGGRERTRSQYDALLHASGWTIMDDKPLRGGFHRLRAQRREAG